MTSYPFIEKAYIALLSQKIKAEYNALIHEVSLLPLTLFDLKQLDGTGGKISLSDLIAYQIGWGRFLINWYEAGLKGEIPLMPGEGFKTWNYVGLARHFYQRYGDLDYKKQLQELCLVVSSIIDITEKEYQIGRLDQIGVWEWCKLKSGKEWPLSKWIIVNTSSPYKRATQLIRKVLKN